MARTQRRASWLAGRLCLGLWDMVRWAASLVCEFAESCPAGWRLEAVLSHHPAGRQAGQAGHQRLVSDRTGSHMDAPMHPCATMACCMQLLLNPQKQGALLIWSAERRCTRPTARLQTPHEGRRCQHAPHSKAACPRHAYSNPLLRTHGQAQPRWHCALRAPQSQKSARPRCSPQQRGAGTVPHRLSLPVPPHVQRLLQHRARRGPVARLVRHKACTGRDQPTQPAGRWAQ